MQSAERVSEHEASDNYVFQRSALAYHVAAGMVSGRVLEVGTGAGYGIEAVAPHAAELLTIDKTLPAREVLEGRPNVEFRQMQVPPLEGIESESFDFVISFQVIEHIKNDTLAIAELNRVLKKGGRLIISTPNRDMSLTRNPWHVREYTPLEFGELLESVFSNVEAMGVFGNEKVIEYYESNRLSVEAVLRYDILGLNRWLPRRMLQIPYDIMNRRNRRKLLENNSALTSSIEMNDYHIAPVGEGCIDLFYIAKKL